MKKSITKFRKIIMALLIGYLLFLASSICAFADDDETLIEELFTEAEFQKALSFIQNAEYIDEEYDPSKTNFQSGFKFHYLDATSFQEKLLSSENVMKLISQRTDWIITTQDDFYYHVYEVNGEQGVGIADYSDEACDKKSIEASFVDIENVSQLVTEKIQTEDLLVKPVCIYVAAYDAYFVYFKTETDAYVIPYSDDLSHTGMENGKCSTLSDAAKTLEELHPLSEMKEGMAGGGFTESNKTKSTIHWIIAISVAVLLASVIIFFFIKRRSHHNSIFSALLLLFISIFSMTNRAYASYNYAASISAVSQAKSNWCWAACAEMAGKNACPSTTRDQWYAVSILKGSSYPNVMGTIEECSAAASIITNSTRSYSYTTTNMYSIFKNKLMSGYVSVAYMSGHAIAIYRLDNNSGSDKIYFVDPDGAYYRNYPYSQFSAGAFGGRVMTALTYVS